MKKYLLVNKFYLPGKAEKAFTEVQIVEAESPDGALASLSYEEYVSSRKLIKAVKKGTLEEDTVAIYELASKHNFLEDVVTSNRNS
ncbi:hypothetical protein [Levilactobacillus spicheri]|uniref:Uncharacterized protein n=1 Tax=Levilactobacillus spicheri TaxID=216463 RepID=A0ABQ0WTI1_9LACO|nr:hypothetical protein [Levilactobacillus spicheri]GEO68045.1 hypothetical protein LSP04_24640 [Levilactobacillus spicheri]